VRCGELRFSEIREVIYMEKPETFVVETEQISPIKMDKYLDEKTPKTEREFMEQAKKKIYTDERGIISVPADAVKASMRFASGEIGRKMESKRNRQTVQSAIFIEPEYINIEPKKKKPDEIVWDLVTRKGQGDKVTRVKTWRPLIKKWKLKFKVISYGVPKEFIQEALEKAGFRFGLLSHRPKFGRFLVKSIRKFR